MKTSASPLLRAFVPILFYLVNFLAIYLLLRGHQLPGGGFIAGLTSAVSWILLIIALPSQDVESFLGKDLFRWAIGGFFLSLIVGVIPLFWGFAFLTHWKIGPISSALLFDIGIYFIVLGVVGKIGFSLFRAKRKEPPLTPTERERYRRRGDP